jgi:hypothetical protein
LTVTAAAANLCKKHAVTVEAYCKVRLLLEVARWRKASRASLLSKGVVGGGRLLLLLLCVQAC